MKNPTIVDRDRVAKGLDEQWAALVMLAPEIAPEDWSRPTDCPGWTVKDVYAHIVGTESMLLGRPSPEVDVPGGLDHVRNDMGRINEAWVQAYRDRTGFDVVSDLAEVVTERRAALALQDQFDFDQPSWTPAGDDTYGRFMRIRVFDQWFHEQDVREAIGQPGHLEGIAPELVLEEIGMILGYVIGKQAKLPEGTTLRFDLTEPMSYVYDIEVAERARVVDELEADPKITLMMPGATFCRLAGGRRAWDEQSIQDKIALDGDEVLAQKVLSNLAFTI